MQKRAQFTVAVYAILKKENKILLMKRCHTGYADGMYVFPGGHLEYNESIYEAVKRELKEEVGIIVEEKAISLATTIQRITPHAPYLDFFCFVSEWEKEPCISEPDLCDDVSWFHLNDLPDTMLDFNRKALENSMLSIPMEFIPDYPF